jgi:hypothetical protein
LCCGKIAFCYANGIDKVSWMVKIIQPTHHSVTPHYLL